MEQKEVIELAIKNVQDYFEEEITTDDIATALEKIYCYRGENFDADAIDFTLKREKHGLSEKEVKLCSAVVGAFNQLEK